MYQSYKVGLIIPALPLCLLSFEPYPWSHPLYKSMKKHPESLNNLKTVGILGGWAKRKTYVVLGDPKLSASVENNSTAWVAEVKKRAAMTLSMQHFLTFLLLGENFLYLNESVVLWMLGLKMPAATVSDTASFNILVGLFCPLKIRSGSSCGIPACSVNALKNQQLWVSDATRLVWKKKKKVLTLL